MDQSGKGIKKVAMMKALGGSKMKVLYFAELKDIINQQSESIDLSDRVRVADFKDLLLQRHPELTHKQFQIAVNEEFVKDTDMIGTGDTVALIPPVSGG